MSKLIIFAALVALAIAQEETETPDAADPEDIYQGLVYGMGKGTFTVVIFAFIGLLFCFFKDLSYFPNCMVCFGTCLPLSIFLFIYWLPKETLSSDAASSKDAPTSLYFIKSILMLIVVALGLLFAICAVLFANCRNVSIRRIDSEVGAN